MKTTNFIRQRIFFSLTPIVIGCIMHYNSWAEESPVLIDVNIPEIVKTLC